MATIIAADSQPVCILGLRSHFEKSLSFALTKEVVSFAELKSALAQLAYDIIILDLHIKGYRNLKDIQTLRQLAPGSKIVVFTTVQPAYFESALLKYGADLYVEKTKSLQYLESHIEQLLHQPDYGKASPYESPVKLLSGRELEVLQLLAQGLKNKEIGTKLQLNEKTISTYKLRLLTKLEVSNTLDLVQKAQLTGIL
ncbi:LuxR C-terminal-related transcriptional regulator [Flavobacterium sp. JP2137]|uniref:LuxR C-terminal-related transcriptional regulator n=1 Tax=Flavobacterium sp. JP2137 TaxID=3414510 RepID=UPI003D2F9E7C